MILPLYSPHMSVCLCLSFSFEIVVLWAQGWILFCYEAYAFSKCSMFVEWMDEWAVMENNTFSCYVTLKLLLASHRFCGAGRDFPLQGWARCKTDWTTWHCHLALSLQQGSCLLIFPTVLFGDLPILWCSLWPSLHDKLGEGNLI